MSQPSAVQVSLSPAAGFCVKSNALNAVSCKLASSASETLDIPAGLKIFVNIAWDANVPPPPDGSDAAIERAMDPSTVVDLDHASHWWVPVIVSDPRPDTDKAGKPSVVFDCVFNSSLKSRTLRSPEFKTFIIELAFQRIEAQHSLLLSRQIGMPNITSKGKLKPRSVLIPSSLFGSPASGPSSSAPATKSTAKPLIEELPASASTVTAPKSILKKPSSTPDPSSVIPDLTWSRTDDGRLRIALSVPHLTRDSIPHTTLDIEPRRLIFTAPGSNAQTSYSLDLDFSKPDSAIQALFASHSTAQHALTLKRERALDVDGARAEWRVAEGTFVIYA